MKAKNISQTEFARRCGCSPSRISALLNHRYGQLTPIYIW
ncbi:helix-turn-helix domain-containing protein [Bacillus infantis]|nr:helix-turn-helix transcriptional regulator [Bacillus infantis]